MNAPAAVGREVRDPVQGSREATEVGTVRRPRRGGGFGRANARGGALACVLTPPPAYGTWGLGSRPAPRARDRRRGDVGEDVFLHGERDKCGCRPGRPAHRSRRMRASGPRGVRPTRWCSRPLERRVGSGPASLHLRPIAATLCQAAMPGAGAAHGQGGRCGANREVPGGDGCHLKPPARACVYISLYLYM